MTITWSDLLGAGVRKPSRELAEVRRANDGQRAHIRNLQDENSSLRSSVARLEFEVARLKADKVLAAAQRVVEVGPWRVRPESIKAARVKYECVGEIEYWLVVLECGGSAVNLHFDTKAEAVEVLDLLMPVQP